MHFQQQQLWHFHLQHAEAAALIVLHQLKAQKATEQGRKSQSKEQQKAVEMAKSEEEKLKQQLEQEALRKAEEDAQKKAEEVLFTKLCLLIKHLETMKELGRLTML